MTEDITAEVERALAKHDTNQCACFDGPYDVPCPVVRSDGAWLRALLARVRELEAAHRGDISLLEMVNADLAALREQLTEREEAAFRAGWNWDAAFETVDQAFAAWRASQKGTPT